MDPISYKIDHDPSQGHLEVFTQACLVVRVMTPQTLFHEHGLSILSTTPTISHWLGYLEVPHHLWERVDGRSSGWSFHLACVCTGVLRGFGVLHDTRLFPYRRLVIQQITFVPFLSLVEAVAHSLDYVPIWYEFLFILD